MAQGRHTPFCVFAVFLTCVAFAANFILRLFAWGAIDPATTTVFKNTSGDVWQFYHLDISPAPWTFIIWALIQAWQVAMLLYSITTLCRRRVHDALYVQPGALPVPIYFVYFLALGSDIVWVFTWTSYMPEVSLVFAAIAALLFYVAFGVAVNKSYKHGPTMLQQHLQGEITFLRLFVHNGLAIYATWMTFTTVLNLSIVLTYVSNIDPVVSSTVGLSVILFAMLAWFFLDGIVLDEYTRYTVSPYIVLVVTTLGMFCGHINLDDRIGIFLLFNFGAGCVLSILKLIMLAYRHKKRPIFETRPFMSTITNDSYGATSYSPLM